MGTREDRDRWKREGVEDGRGAEKVRKREREGLREKVRKRERERASYATSQTTAVDGGPKGAGHKLNKR
jgi:hypothetical protein